MKRVPEAVWWIAVTALVLGAAAASLWIGSEVRPGTEVLVGSPSGIHRSDLKIVWYAVGWGLISGWAIAAIWRLSVLTRNKLWTWRTVQSVRRERQDRAAEASHDAQV